MKRWIATAAVVLLLMGLCACAAAQTPQTQAPADESTNAAIDGKTEPFVKAVWVPFMEVNAMLQSGDVASSKTAIEAMLDDCVARGVNTVYFHVRANSDAYYVSTVFSPHRLAKPLVEIGFDPLAFTVEEAHERGLELHAWVNPYRIGADNSFAKTAEIFEYSGKWYYDPTSPDNQQLIVRGIEELVKNYQIDGVQFDDYFYPEGAVPATAPASFEEARYQQYRENVGSIAVGDWRREQVSRLVSLVYAACHERTGCVFGISPGYNIDHNREKLYADLARWASNIGYIDYVCPQLYFGYQHQYAPFSQLLATWGALPRAEGVALYAGLGLYKTGLTEDTYAGVGKTEWATGGDIIARQLADVKAMGYDGAALYSHQSFEADGTRDAAVVKAECDAACKAWKEF